MIFDEQFIRFEFGDDWQIIKLDEHPDYRTGIEKIDGTKAVDFIGIFDNQTIFFIEVKDFRGHRIENKDRLQGGLLADEFRQKVRDSLACLVGSYRTRSANVSQRSEIWEEAFKLIQNRRKQLIIVLWLEHDLPSYDKLRRKALAGIGASVLRSKLAWLTPHVIVSSMDNNTLPDIQVSNLARKTT